MLRVFTESLDDQTVRPRTYITKLRIFPPFVERCIESCVYGLLTSLLADMDTLGDRTDMRYDGFGG